MIYTVKDCSGQDIDLEREEFKVIGRVHEWRRYIPDGFKKIWAELPSEAKFCMFVMASRQAKDEEWD